MTSRARRLKPTRDDLKVSKSHHWNGKRAGFFTAVGISFWTLQLLFLMVLCLLYGTQYNVRNSIHNLPVLAVDYDGGLVGESLKTAYGQLRSKTFPSVYFESASAYPDLQSLKDAVGSGKYWGAVYTWPNASAKLSAALSGGEAAATYNATQMITFIWLEAHYTTTSEGYIQPSLTQLITTSSATLQHINGTAALASLNQTSLPAVQAYLSPIIPSSINLKPTHHGTRVLYNTASVALSIIQMFFFVMAINGISGVMSLFSRLTILTNLLVRQGLAASYTFVASLLEIGYIWAFKEDWPLSAGVFFCLWLLTWLHMWINFLVIDSAASVVPLQWMPYVLITYVILNIASSLACIPIAPAFYHYAYAMPSHNWYEGFVTIVTGGLVNNLYRVLPVLFSWFILGQLAGAVAMTWKCHAAQEAAAAAAANNNNNISVTKTRESRNEKAGAGIASGDDDDTDLESGNGNNPQATTNSLSTVPTQVDSPSYYEDNNDNDDFARGTTSLWRLATHASLSMTPDIHGLRQYSTNNNNSNTRRGAGVRRKSGAALTTNAVASSPPLYGPSIPVGFEGIERMVSREVDREQEQHHQHQHQQQK